jgi:Na+-transporting NADH:ubiquinone oxidoreductase subunit F
VPDAVLGIKELVCRVSSNRNVATFIKELVLELPPGETLEFSAGAFIQILCPPFRTRFTDFDVAAPFRADWDRMDLWRHEVSSTAPILRSYSLANYPGEGSSAKLIVRIATPPPGAPPSVPPGVVSSYVFQLQPGDEVTIVGPFCHFRVAETDKEMVFVGGGAGMAPMRSMILDQLLRRETRRKITFWYGARSRKELFYDEEFDRLQREHDTFRWVAALSEPKPDDDWSGPVGFIHQVLHDQYLQDHPAPEECEYYLCGPPMMLEVTRSMLDELGVEPASIRFDAFGS